MDINVTVDELIDIEQRADDLAKEIKAARSRFSAGGKKIVAKEWIAIVGKAAKLLASLVAGLT